MIFDNFVKKVDFLLKFGFYEDYLWNFVIVGNKQTEKLCWAKSACVEDLYSPKRLIMKNGCDFYY